MSTPTNSADASCGELSCDECNARTAALTTERDQLRADRTYNHECINRLAGATGTLGENSEGVVDAVLSTIDQLRAEVERLRAGIEECLHTNAHLADGEDCTLIGLKRCLRSDLAGVVEAAAATNDLKTSN